ncbi:hypothetical protein GMORB2_4687 [Geosmithia morbida]|uniref:Uncharacterized protein n=1 Tax=Geosmithia morbida TaxID=1094350 RepID=A0A9P4YPR3_9HYPO|nr:uncharacterized protein GMORB2_4687 [Geosmithia morbida]KAF4119557.1 hypothetical protein GMORB2_4687 [Geosmithia morbida]
MHLQAVFTAWSASRIRAGRTAHSQHCTDATLSSLGAPKSLMARTTWYRMQSSALHVSILGQMIETKSQDPSSSPSFNSWGLVFTVDR